VEIAQNPANQLPQAKLGYQRAELAVIPTNRSADIEAGSAGNGAADHANVLMEIKYAGIFDLGQASGIYQRLAVGEEAVKQPGAAFMFARDSTGYVSEAAAASIENATKSLRNVPIMSEAWEKKFTKLTEARAKAAQQKREDADDMLNEWGFASWDQAIDKKPRPLTEGEIDELLKLLK